MESNETTIITPRGTIFIQESFSSEQDAHNNGYGYWFTHRNTEGKQIDIYSKALDENGYRNKFAIVSY